MDKKLYKIVNKSNNKYLILLKKNVEKKIKKLIPKFNNNLSELHNFISTSQINNIRLKCYSHINTKVNWQKIIQNICIKEVKEILGPDILIQTKLNLSIQMPNDETSLLPIHSDSWSSDTPFQINLWIPLTNAFDSNSMFLINPKKSLQSFKKIIKTKNINFYKPKKKEFLNIKFGQILFFNPALLHGNIKNRTNRTRVSLNIRFKSLFCPEPKNKADRKFGTYYKKFIISENTKFGTEILNIGMLK
tara:strand:+ start:846 stop:1586 length:741 start_codon:yes stop_codon:yes gene_type:complete